MDAIPFSARELFGSNTSTSRYLANAFRLAGVVSRKAAISRPACARSCAIWAVRWADGLVSSVATTGGLVVIKVSNVLTFVSDGHLALRLSSTGQIHDRRWIGLYLDRRRRTVRCSGI